MTYVVLHVRSGFLKVPDYRSDNPTVNDTFSIVLDPSLATACGPENASILAGVMNRREDTKQWRAVKWVDAQAWVKDNVK